MPSKTSGFSSAPWARTTWPARTFQSRSRGAPSGAVARSVRQALREPEQVPAVVADRRGAGHHRDVREGRQLGEGGGEPVPGGLAVDDHGGLGEEGAAGLGGLVDEHDGRAGAAGGERRGEAGRAGADDQDVGVGEAGGVAVGVGLGRRDAEAGGVADDGS